MKYRPEIDGLRALAVISVILFHAGFDLISGGYVGVDIFFVISGFLITTIIYEEIKSGKFSIINFYERRVRRILPALFFMVLVTIPIAWFLLSPYDMKYYSKSIAYVAIFLSNTIFYKQSGYFDTSAELKPLLHTWSLGVEEQYYIFFPLLLVFMWRYAKDYIHQVFITIFIISLLLANYMVYVKPAAAFFLFQYRVWELLTGSILAIFVLRNISTLNLDRLHNPLSITGFILLTCSIFLFDKSIPFPSLYTLVPIIGTALIILFASDKTFIGKLLSLKPIVAIGLLSFSAYLWHQPLFAFFRHASNDDPTLAEMSLLIIVVFVIATLSWKYIETPFRNKSFLNKNNCLVYFLLCLLDF